MPLWTLPGGGGMGGGTSGGYLWQQALAETATWQGLSTADVTAACVCWKECVSCNQGSEVHDLEEMQRKCSHVLSFCWSPVQSGGDVVLIKPPAEINFLSFWHPPLRDHVFWIDVIYEHSIIYANELTNQWWAGERWCCTSYISSLLVSLLESPFLNPSMHSRHYSPLFFLWPFALLSSSCSPLFISPLSLSPEWSVSLSAHLLWLLILSVGATAAFTPS